MIRRPPRSTPLYSSAASDVYKRQTDPFHPPDHSRARVGSRRSSPFRCDWKQFNPEAVGCRHLSSPARELGSGQGACGEDERMLTGTLTSRLHRRRRALSASTRCLLDAREGMRGATTGGGTLPIAAGSVPANLRGEPPRPAVMGKPKIDARKRWRINPCLLYTSDAADE